MTHRLGKPGTSWFWSVLNGLNCEPGTEAQSLFSKQAKALKSLDRGNQHCGVHIGESPEAAHAAWSACRISTRRISISACICVRRSPTPSADPPRLPEEPGAQRGSGPRRRKLGHLASSPTHGRGCSEPSNDGEIRLFNHGGLLLFSHWGLLFSHGGCCSVMGGH